MKTPNQAMVILFLVAVATFARGQVPVYDGVSTPSGVQFSMVNNVIIGQEVFMDPGQLAAILI